jgi:hypothetical protein
MSTHSDREVRAQIAADKRVHDKPENRVVRDGQAVCKRCGRDWDSLVHGC